tara:strand:+ start:16 stop:1170 length:1155 start_codon:yes stop_codon:yes gene_type:complete
MATRGMDTALVKAVSDSYINYDNAPGMYDGLDKISGAAKDFAEDYKVDKEKQEATLLKEEAALLEGEKKKNAKQEKDWKDVAGDVHTKLGSFKSKTDYDYYFDEIQSLKGDLFAAQNEVPPNQKGITAATLAVNNLKEEVADTVDLRATWAAAEDEGVGMSSAMKGTDSLEGNDGRDVTIVTEWMRENYAVSKNDEEERVYTFEQGDLPEGTKLTYTKNQLEEMYIPRDYKAPTAYMKLLGQHGNKRFVNEEVIKGEIKEIVPKGTKGLRAFVADKIGSKTFLQRLDGDKNLRAEVENQFKYSASNPDNTVDTNKDGVITDIEFAAFKQAIVDPYSSVWLVDEKADMNKWEEYARPIVEEALYYGAVNQQNARGKEEGEEGLFE